ncbi:MAG: hypothetical protein R3F60_30845 [bacterium]
MKVVNVLLALALVGLPVGGAMAQDAPAAGGDVKTKFYNFDDLLIDGEYKKPQVLYTDARQKVKFERLLKLKKDFLPRLKATAKDAVLR